MADDEEDIGLEIDLEGLVIALEGLVVGKGLEMVEVGGKELFELENFLELLYEWSLVELGLRLEKLPVTIRHIRSFNR